jgi:hypothetical protein
VARREGDGARRDELAPGDVAALKERDAARRRPDFPGQSPRADDVGADSEWWRLADDIFPEATVERAVVAAPLGTRLLLSRDGEPIVGVPMKTPITIALGPEGGMEPAERDAFIAAAFLPVKLGETTLRFETAGVAAVAIAAAALALTKQSNG